VSFLSVGNNITEISDFAGALFDTTTFLSTTPSPPSVVTTSYGFDEAQFSPQDLQYVVVLFCAHVSGGFFPSHAPSQEDLQWIHGRRCSRHLCYFRLW
jgi:hypothetical protein